TLLPRRRRAASAVSTFQEVRRKSAARGELSVPNADRTKFMAYFPASRPTAPIWQPARTITIISTEYDRHKPDRTAYRLARIRFYTSGLSAGFRFSHGQVADRAHPFDIALEQRLR